MVTATAVLGLLYPGFTIIPSCKVGILNFPTRATITGFRVFVEPAGLYGDRSFTKGNLPGVRDSVAVMPVKAESSIVERVPQCRSPRVSLDSWTSQVKRPLPVIPGWHARYINATCLTVPSGDYFCEETAYTLFMIVPQR